MDRLAWSVYQTYLLIREYDELDLHQLRRLRMLGRTQIWKHVKILEGIGAVKRVRRGVKVYVKHVLPVEYDDILSYLKPAPEPVVDRELAVMALRVEEATGGNYCLAGLHAMAYPYRPYLPVKYEFLVSPERFSEETFKKLGEVGFEVNLIPSPFTLMESFEKMGVKVAANPVEAWLYCRTVRVGDSAEIPVVVLDLKAIPWDSEDTVIRGLLDLVRTAMGGEVNIEYSPTKPITLWFSATLKVHKQQYVEIVKALSKAGVAMIIDTARLELYTRKIMGWQE